MNVRTGFLPVVLALSIGGVSAACSTTTSSTATARVNRRSTTTTTLAPTAAGLHNELLTRSSLPASWSVTSQPGTFSLACLTDAKVVADSTVHATVVFVHNAANTTLTATVFVETLAYFPNGATGQTTTIDHDLDACGTVSQTNGGTKLTGTVKKLSFPAIANEVHAWSGVLSGIPSTGSANGVSLSVYVVAFRKGSTVGLLDYVTSSAPSVTSVAKYARQAAKQVTA